MNNKTKLTIVLTLKDRAEFTYRWMKYMDDITCPHRIFIADGGKDIGVEQHLRNHKNYPNLNYEYIRYPYDAKIVDYYMKFKDVISRVESEYLLLADNDDFYLLEHIPDILSFLDTHKDYAGARGKLVNFTLFDRQGRSNGITVGKRYLAILNDALSIEKSCSYERVEDLCNNMSRYDYYANWYSVFRTASFQKTWELLITLPIKEVIVTEMLTHIMMLMEGKLKIMNFPFYIRQNNTSLSGDTLVTGNKFLERCIINNALSEFGIAIDKFIMIKTNEEKERLLKSIASWLEVFVSNIYLSKSRPRIGFFLRSKIVIKRSFIFNRCLSIIYYRLICLFFPWRKGIPIRFKLIEPYILIQSKVLKTEGGCVCHGN
ncbi:MAG: TIGR00180 family glycosyltransferase [Mobilitalea sp.]